MDFNNETDLYNSVTGNNAPSSVKFWTFQSEPAFRKILALSVSVTPSTSQNVERSTLHFVLFSSGAVYEFERGDRFARRYATGWERGGGGSRSNKNGNRGGSLRRESMQSLSGLKFYLQLNDDGPSCVCRCNDLSVWWNEREKKKSGRA